MRSTVVVILCLLAVALCEDRYPQETNMCQEGWEKVSTFKLVPAEANQFLRRFTLTFELCHTTFNGIGSGSKAAGDILYNDIWVPFTDLKKRSEGNLSTQDSKELFEKLKTFRAASVKRLTGAILMNNLNSKVPACSKAVKTIKILQTRWPKVVTPEYLLTTVKAIFSAIRSC
eukprot:TRINITY_DN0_c734_g1_i2.p1 TRINITY_DN0_c734_g1~~TRINITY_DN0_c734_g1_i2.p1  ORF type:complete len:173 (+),score=54.89 TRINITY_DN0_c734_g1_i2:35-553(+)